MAALKMTLEGTGEMKARFKHMTQDQGLRKELRRATVAVGERELEHVLRPSTPYKTGKLRDSERLLVMASEAKEDLRVSYVAGNEAAWYARIVESRTKFMEKFVLGLVPTIGGKIAAELDLQAAVGP